MDELRELRVSNDAMNDEAELQERMAEEGYLFFRQLQSPDKLLNLRREIMSAVQQASWLIQGTDPMDGVADINKQYTEGDNEYSAGYAKAYKLESFHRAAHCPEVTSIVEKITGKPMMPQPSKVARVWFPKYIEHTTPKHQDFVHFQGSFDNITCWAPVGDCPIELGGLAIIPGSHKVNRVLDHHFSLGAGGLVVDETAHEDVNPIWHSTNYAIGDTLFFPALTIHKALPNYTEDKLRISLDNRYQAVGDPIAAHMLEPHWPSQLSWDEVYADWENDDLKYYWQQLDNPVVPFDASFHEKGFAEAIELARAGDQHAIYSMKRIVKDNQGLPFKAKAQSVLAEL